MTAFIFLLVKALTPWQSDYDTVFMLVFLGLDVIGWAEWTRIWLHQREK